MRNSFEKLPKSTWTKVVSSVLVAATAGTLTTSTLAGCSNERKEAPERWVTTQNTTVAMDWDKINEAYKQAQGPEDFEKRVNEIYEGDEVISVSVRDVDEKAQEVVGFFDKNSNGQVEDAEKIFTVRRDLVSQDKGQYQIQGYGPYAGYHSPMWDIAAGMLLGSMISNMFMPSYRPMYTTPYVTSTSRMGELRSSRDAYRAQNPSRFSQPKASAGTGRTYGSKSSSGFGSGSSSSSGSRSSGGRFGIRRSSKRDRKRLTA